ncbi:Gfo/Idh/MocA family protein [Gordonia sp. CPCC 205515]|uniref:Gfo/Idh/MocA family protein n=1 Tax=Gordonia sp. CPCC 205515 TaxID=3140791 RepID=UPI003AF3B14D
MSTLPVARTPDPRSAPVLRWGILGPGWIAARFVAALNAHTEQKVVAVGSRSLPRAQEFAQQHGIGAAHGSYEELLADPQVDIIYVCTPHTEHRPNALAVLDAGKHVLVEKPLGINASQAREIADRSRATGLFAGEAMWTRFLPKFDVLRRLLDDGALGEIRTVMADHGEFFTTDHRIYNPALAGGPMLDLGSYPVAFAQWTIGSPTRVAALGTPANDELNGQISAILGTASGAQALINTTILSDTPTDAAICGVDATIAIPGPFYQPGPFELRQRKGETLRYIEEHGGHEAGLHFSAVDAAREIVAGNTESTTHPLANVVATLHTMDAIRSELDIVFVGEGQS